MEACRTSERIHQSACAVQQAQNPNELYFSHGATPHPILHSDLLQVAALGVAVADGGSASVQYKRNRQTDRRTDRQTDRQRSPHGRSVYTHAICCLIHAYALAHWPAVGNNNKENSSRNGRAPTPLLQKKKLAGSGSRTGTVGTTERSGLARSGLAWPGLAWCGLVWPGVAWGAGSHRPAESGRVEMSCRSRAAVCMSVCRRRPASPFLTAQTDRAVLSCPVRATVLPRRARRYETDEAASPACQGSGVRGVCSPVSGSNVHCAGRERVCSCSCCVCLSVWCDKWPSVSGRGAYRRRITASSQAADSWRHRHTNSRSPLCSATVRYSRGSGLKELPGGRTL